MPLPAYLHELLTQAYPELILLEPEQRQQLEAYLEAPDRFQTKLSQVQEERRQGRDDHLRAKRQHEEFLRYLKRVAAYNRNETSSTSIIPSAAKEGRSDQITEPEDEPTIEDAFRCAAGILRSLETLKNLADESRPPRLVEETFDKLCSDLRGLDLALSKRKIGDAFIQARLPVDSSSNAHKETRSWHHAVWAIGLDWYQQIFRVVDGALLLQLRLTQPTRFRFDELPGGRVADGWRPDETFEGTFELRPGDLDPTANVEGRLQRMPRPDFDHLLMMLDQERAIASGNRPHGDSVASIQTDAESKSVSAVRMGSETSSREQENDEETQSHELKVNHAKFAICYKGQICVLNNTKEFSVIERLNQCPGDYLPIQTLIDDVWEDSQTSNETVQKTISNLRGKLRDAGIQGVKIDGKTNPGYYALILT